MEARTGNLANSHSKDDPANTLTATISMSLYSPIFVAPGGDAREVLELIALSP